MSTAAVEPLTPRRLAGLFGVTSADPGIVAGVVDRVGSWGFDRWQQQVAGCGHCSRPVRLQGSISRHHRGTGAKVGTGYSTSGEPDGVLLVRCGNRRAAVCPSCSREYAGDLWHLLHAGIAGGDKGVPPAVATRPLVFATLTAPSFGLVHTTRTDRHGQTARCRPRRDRARVLCPHGRPSWCMAVHGSGDDRLGAPLCDDCYDAEGAVWFNYYASAELWRRFTTALPRALAARLGMSERVLRGLMRVQYAKVAEFQRRGVVHFHAVLRLDGPATPGDPYPAPLLDVPVQLLADAVHDAADHVTYRVPRWREDRPGVVLRFGRQVDVSPIRGGDGLQAGAVTPGKVAGYIAKYATKGADDFGLDGRLSCPADLDLRPVPVPPHVRRLVETVHALAAVEPRLGRWLHMLGFPGHFATKSRAFSTTMGALRRQRRQHRRQQTPGPADELPDQLDDETTLVIGTWRFAGLGYTTAGDVELAAAAAARAREHRDNARAARQHGLVRPDVGVLPVAAGS